MATDHALRRTVVDLDALGESDRTAILDLLEPRQRERVETLLRAYAGIPANRSESSDASIDVSNLSPWLEDRLLTEGTMTSKARAALRECAASVPARDHVGDVGQRPSLLGRLWATLPGVGRP